MEGGDVRIDRVPGGAAANLEGAEARYGAVHGRLRLLRSGSTESSPAAGSEGEVGWWRRCEREGGMGWRQAVRQVDGDESESS